MNKTLFKVIECGNEFSIYQQSGGQFCNPRVYTGWRAKVIKFFIDKVFCRV